MVRRQDIQNYARAIARRFRPEKIILFGSHAYGKPDADSDVDLLVVMPHRGHALDKAFEIRNELEHPGFSVDLLVRSPGELARRVRLGDFFVKEVLCRGRLLYARADA